MHFANIQHSDRLQKLMSVLSDGYEHVTHEIQQRTGSMAPATDVSEARKNGVMINCRYICRSEGGRKVYGYRIATI
jgi:hypothetical protein